jgi:hypothetical protein
MAWDGMGWDGMGGDRTAGMLSVRLARLLRLYVRRRGPFLGWQLQQALLGVAVARRVRQARCQTG